MVKSVGPVSVRALPPTRRSSAAIALARGIGVVSRAWRQRGLGTGFKLLHQVPGLRSAKCEVEFMPGARFETEVFEPYWGPTLLGGRPYEPEVLTVLRWLAPLAPTFIDGGANCGFWSVITTAPELAYPRVVAIEASATTFERLRSNAERNGSRFVPLLRAIGATSGRTLHLSDAALHAVAYVTEDGTGPEVTTITIDDVVTEMNWWEYDRFLIKIDVEGHEIPAIGGARRLMESKDHAFVFEDFEKNAYKTLEHLLGLGYEIVYVSTVGEVSFARSLVEAMRALSREPKPKGSRNFLAVKEGSFADVLHQRARMLQNG